MYNRPSMFQGRNGSDQLSVFLVAIALVIVIIYPFFPQVFVRAILCIGALALCGWSLFRMLSENTAKRRYENEKFLSFFKHGDKSSSSSNYEEASFKDASAKDEKKRRKQEQKEAERKQKEAEKAKKEARKEEEKTHCFFKCPKCNTELRVPKGKGKIIITCPKCGEKFEERT